ncbi:Glyoxalase/Bleomycin resistance protein/Dihydroxybiphenyl dioxygenase [Lizonia empirigonia]|nr:Glyoxalase/Bleomycin resistance protein/Dihydroxybiphenyl dioxygenase [Lizonia empirigonia]
MNTTPSTATLLDSSPTTDYRLNHFMLRISNPARTLHFYTHLMGMRLVFSRDVGPMTLYYLGYPQTGEHRRDPEAYARDTRPHSVLTRTLGLLEFGHYHSDEGSAGALKISTGVDAPLLGFNHLGFTVPDVGAAVERLRRGGVEVVKGREAKVTSAADLSVGFGGLFKQLAFVRDPDGYLVELVPQVLQ